MSIKYVVSESKTISLELNNKTYNIAPDHPFYPRIVAAIKNEDKEILYDLLTSELGGIAQVDIHGKVTWNGKELHNVIVDRIKEMINIGLKPDPMLRFLENLMLNPSEESREELYEFLSHRNLPITEDGCFLGYKAIRNNYKDIYSGTVDNSPGKVISMPRENVDSNRHRHCSYGYHIGTMDYVRWYGNRAGSRFIIVKIDPKDAVSVPPDHGAQKLRCCKYEVIREIEKGNVLDFPVYSSDGGEEYDNLMDFEEANWNDQDFDNHEEDEEDIYLENLWDDENEMTEEIELNKRHDYINDIISSYKNSLSEDQIYDEAIALNVASKTSAPVIGISNCLLLIAEELAKEEFGQ